MTKLFSILFGFAFATSVCANELDTPQTQMVDVDPNQKVDSSALEDAFVVVRSMAKKTSFNPSSRTPLNADSIVKVRSYDREGFGQGTGAVIYSDKDYSLVVTNSHVIAPHKGSRKGVTVGTRYGNARATILYENRNYQADGNDLAVLLIPSPAVLPAIPISTAYRPGDPVFSAGYPNDSFRLVPRSGHVTDRNFTSGSSQVVQTTGAVLQGESGSPLVNSKGELVAVIDSNDAEAGRRPRHAFGVPSTNLIHVVKASCIGRGQVLGAIGQRILNRAQLRQCLPVPGGQPGLNCQPQPAPQQQQPMIEQAPQFQQPILNAPLNAPPSVIDTTRQTIPVEIPIQTVRGEVGPPGKRGLPGKDGRNGTDGSRGEPGPPGESKPVDVEAIAASVVLALPTKRIVIRDQDTGEVLQEVELNLTDPDALEIFYKRDSFNRGGFDKASLQAAISKEIDLLSINSKAKDRRVLVVNGSTREVIDDETYGPDDPIVLDVQSIVNAATAK